MTNEQSAEQGKAGSSGGDQWRDDAGEETPQASATEEAPQTEQSSQATGASAATGAADADQGAPRDAGDGDTNEVDESLEDKVVRLEQELDQARAQADDYWRRLTRSEADKENIRKRAEKDVETARKQSLEKVASELLGVRDSLEMGVQAAQEDDADVAKVREGTELTLRMLTQAMEKFHIEEIDPAGEKFNPDLHQAMSMQEVEGYESNTVISVMQKGYRLGDRLLRPALVMVAK